MDERDGQAGADQGGDDPLEREELTLPDGRRLILYGRAEEAD